MFYQFFYTKISGAAVKNENMTNQRLFRLVSRELAEELHKSIVSKFGKMKSILFVHR